MPDDPHAPRAARTIVYSGRDETKHCTKCSAAFTWLRCVTKPRGDWNQNWCGCTPPETTVAAPKEKVRTRTTLDL